MDVTFIGDPEEPTHPNPHAEGSVVHVTGLVCSSNAHGGTLIARERADPPGAAYRITKAFWDYEVGWRYHGAPTTETEVDALKALGAVARPGDDHVKVYFCEHDVHAGGGR